MSSPLARYFGPTVIRSSLSVLKTQLRPVFGINHRIYTKEEYCDSPFSKVFKWDFDTEAPHDNIMKYFQSPEQLQGLGFAFREGADLLIKENPDDTFSVKDGSSPHGMLHVLDIPNAHAYLFHSPWYPLPKSRATEDLLNRGGQKTFRLFPWSFPTFLDEHSKVQDIRQDPVKLLTWFSGGEAELEEEATKRKQCWESSSLGPVLQLGCSSAIIVEDYTEYLDDKSDLLMRMALFGTTNFHVLDGRLCWFPLVDRKKKRIAMACFGAGRHIIADMDQLNPFGGAVVLSATIRRLLTAINAGVTPGSLSIKKFSSVIAEKDADLGRLCSRLQCLDQQGVGMAYARQSGGVFLGATEPLKKREDLKATYPY